MMKPTTVTTTKNLLHNWRFFLIIATGFVYQHFAQGHAPSLCQSEMGETSTYCLVIPDDNNSAYNTRCTEGVDEMLEDRKSSVLKKPKLKVFANHQLGLESVIRTTSKPINLNPVVRFPTKE